MSFDDVDANRAFAEKFSFNYPLICDTSRAVGMAYGICSDPNEDCARRVTIVISAEGIVEQVIRVRNAESHPALLLASL